MDRQCTPTLRYPFIFQYHRIYTNIKITVPSLPHLLGTLCLAPPSLSVSSGPGEVGDGSPLWSLRRPTHQYVYTVVMVMSLPLLATDHHGTVQKQTYVHIHITSYSGPCVKYNVLMAQQTSVLMQ